MTTRSKNIIEDQNHKRASELLAKHDWRCAWETEVKSPACTLQCWIKGARVVIVQFYPEGHGVEFYYNDTLTNRWDEVEANLKS